MTEKKLLTKEDIKEIIGNAYLAPVITKPILIFGNKTYKTILGKSPEKNLIMIYGNDDTGFLHIGRRHSYKYVYTDWKRDIPNELDTPTSFPKSEILITGWPSIVDRIYSPENLNQTNNNQKEKFELYIGDYVYNNEKVECYLLAYKNTKIIHTLYLKSNKKQFNKPKPKGFHFSKDKIEYWLEPENDKEIMEIPYVDNQKEVQFLVEAQRIISSHEEAWTLKFWKGGYAFQRTLINTITPEMLEKRLDYYQLFGTEHIEKEIGRINRMSIEELLKGTK